MGQGLNYFGTGGNGQPNNVYDLLILKVGGYEVLGRLITADANETQELIETRAGQDTRPNYRPGFVTGTMTVEMVRATDAALFKTLLGTTLAYTHDLGSAGTEVGNGVLRTTGLRVGAGANQTERFELTITGTPTLSGAPSSPYPM